MYSIDSGKQRTWSGISFRRVPISMSVVMQHPWLVMSRECCLIYLRNTDSLPILQQQTFWSSWQVMEDTKGMFGFNGKILVLVCV